MQNKQVYFQANAECPIFAERKSILVKTAGAALAPLADHIQLACVFGSFTHAQQKADSDVDLLVVGDVAFGEVVASLTDAHNQLAREVNPTVYSASKLAEKVSAGHHFLRSVPKKEKVFLIGDERELERLAEKRLVDRA